MDNEIVISYKLSKISQNLLIVTVNRPGKVYKNGKIGKLGLENITWTAAFSFDRLSTVQQ